MPEVTRVSERRGRLKVFVDGEPFAELDPGVAMEKGLREGAAFSGEELEAARVAGERPLAMTRALNVLGYRARSRTELSERLSRAGYHPTTVEMVLGRLDELGYLDDEEYAREAARGKARRYGPRRIYGDLRRAGVEEETARRAVEEEFSGGDELEAALEAARRRYNSVENPGVGEDASGEDEVRLANHRSDQRLARRVYGFLTRRGYSAEVCAEVASRYRS